MSRKMWIVGVLAWLLLVAAAISGYWVEPGVDELQHIALSVVGGLLLFFTQGWFVLDLLLVHRLLGRSAGAPDADRTSAPSLVPVLVPALATMVGIALLELLGGRIQAGLHPAAVHHALSWITAATGLAALWLERGAAERHERLLREAEGRLDGAPAG